MNLSYLTLRRLCDELSEHWTGARVRAGAEQANDLILTGDNGRSICINVAARSHSIFDRPFPAPRELQGPDWAERHLYGATLRAIRQVPFERILEFDFLRLDRLGGRHDITLIVELIGRRSNIILTSGDGRRILSTCRRKKGERAPGSAYTPPDASQRCLPTDLTPEVLRDVLASDRPAHISLTSGISGLDPILSAELLAACAVDPSAPSGESLVRLSDAVRRILDDPPWSPSPAVVTFDDREEICPINLRHVDVGERTEFQSISEAVQELAKRERERIERQGEAQSVRRELEKQIETVERKIERIEADLQDVERADELERVGNTLMASLHDVPERAQSVTLPDPYSTDSGTIDVVLDPDKSPVDNAQDYIKRSRKARKAGPIASKRKVEAEAKRRELQGAVEALEGATGEKLDQLKEDFAEKGWIRRTDRGRKPKQRRRAPGEINPRRYRTSDDWTVLVGRSNKENDKLTKSSARDDVFFHAQGCPGSHVILKREGRPGDPPKTTLEEAACLAAYWSKARSSKTVPVNYTDIRHVTKPRNAAPGLVTIRNEKTVFVRPREIRKADE